MTDDKTHPDGKPMSESENEQYGTRDVGEFTIADMTDKEVKEFARNIATLNNKGGNS
jgi:hypothetical protein